jgi:hypothetical protein
MIPSVTRLYELDRELREELFPTGATGLPEVFGIVVIAVVCAAILVTIRELTPSKVTRE